jgi:hypothetical protein
MQIIYNDKVTNWPYSIPQASTSSHREGSSVGSSSQHPKHCSKLASGTSQLLQMTPSSKHLYDSFYKKHCENRF